MNLYPKSAHLYEFMTNLCQFILIFCCFFLAHLAYALHIDMPTPIFDPKTMICPLKSEKKPENHPFCVIFVLNLIDVSCLFCRKAESFSITFFSCAFLSSANFSRRLLSANAKICTAKIVAFFGISAVLKVEYPLHIYKISPPKQKLTSCLHHSM